MTSLQLLLFLRYHGIINRKISIQSQKILEEKMVLEVTWRIGKKHVQNKRNQILTNRSSEGTYLVSSETYEHLISILILCCRIGFAVLPLVSAGPQISAASFQTQIRIDAVFKQAPPSKKHLTLKKRSLLEIWPWSCRN